LRPIQTGAAMNRDHATLTSQFKNYLIKQDLSERTVKGYLDDLQFFQGWYEEIQNKKLDWKEITSFDLQTFRQYLVNGKRQKVTSVNRRVQALKRFFNWAHDHGFIKNESPVENLRFMRKQTPNQPHALEKSEVHNLLRTAGQSSHGLSKRNYAILQLMLQSGLRIGEVISLKFSDVTLQSRSGTVKIVDGKGGKSREVPLNLTARQALGNYFKQCKRKNVDDPIFYSKRQGALSLRSMQAMIQNLVKNAKITRVPVSAHTLRHTFATNYLRANPNQLVELAQLLGHDSLNTTAIYTKSSQAQLAEAVEKSEINIYGDS
jgi:site-specific recombinase XerD